MTNDNQTPFLTPNEIGPAGPLPPDTLTTASTAFDLPALHTSTGPYVMRVYRPWLTPERLKSVQHIRAILFHQSLPIPQPP